MFVVCLFVEYVDLVELRCCPSGFALIGIYDKSDDDAMDNDDDDEENASDDDDSEDATDVETTDWDDERNNVMLSTSEPMSNIL
jgi:hypothetical protein